MPSPGTVLDLGQLAPGVGPGLQSTNFSPISDCGRISQEAPSWNGVKPGLSIFSVSAARLSGVTSRLLTSPTTAPAIFTSSPLTM